MRRARDFSGEVEVAELQATAASYRAELAGRQVWPEIRLEEVWLRTNSPADAFGLQLNQEIFSFPAFAASDPNRPRAVTNALTRFELSVPVYAGGEIRRRTKQATLVADAARTNAVWQADAAALAAAEAWIYAAQAREHVALLERSLETLDAHVSFARAYVDQGLMVRSELLRSEVERARLADLLSAARASERVSASALGFRVGAHFGAEFDLGPIPAPPSPPAEQEVWLTDLSERGDLAQVRSQAEVALLEAEVAARTGLPRLGLVGRLDFNDADLLGTGGDSSTLMVRGSLPLWSGGRRRAARDAADADAAAAARGALRYGEAVRLEVVAAWAEATSAWERMETARSAIESAAEARRIVDARVREGVARTLDLLDVVTALREAETRELVARAEAQLSRLRLAHRAGFEPEAAFEADPSVRREESSMNPPSSAPRSTSSAQPEQEP